MEYELKIVLYKQLFGKPLNISTKTGADIQLNFSYLFKEIIRNINYLSNDKEKFLKIFRTFWNKKMINIKPSFEKMCELANFLLAIQGSKSKINIEKVKLGLEKVELLHEIHEEEIINLFKNNDGIFKKFIKETWGTRSRIIIYLNKNQEIVQIMIEEGYNNSLKEMLKIGRLWENNF